PGRRGSCGSPAIAVEGNLVERHAFLTIGLALVAGALVLLQALERLTLLRGLEENLPALDQLDLVAPQILLGGLMGALGALQVRLPGDQVGGADRQARRVDLSGASARDPTSGSLYFLFAAAVAQKRAGQLLLGRILPTLAQGADAFESEAERGSVHGPLLDRLARGLSATGRLSEPVLSRTRSATPQAVSCSAGIAGAPGTTPPAG